MNNFILNQNIKWFKEITIIYIIILWLYTILPIQKLIQFMKIWVKSIFYDVSAVPGWNVRWSNILNNHLIFKLLQIGFVLHSDRCYTNRVNIDIYDQVEYVAQVKYRDKIKML